MGSESKQPGWVRNRSLQHACRVMVAVGILNFAAYVIVSLNLGGDAWNGSRSGGHYFLSSHGHLTEVSAGVWRYSRLHTYAVWITHPLTLAAMAVLAAASAAEREDAAAQEPPPPPHDYGESTIPPRFRGLVESEATFEVVSVERAATTTSPNGKLTVVFGRVVEGTVRPGNVVRISGADSGARATVVVMTRIDGPLAEARASAGAVALTISGRLAGLAPGARLAATEGARAATGEG